MPDASLEAEELRTAFANQLLSMISTHNLMLVTGDLGYGVFDDFAELFPNNFLNAGITEQSMTSMAAGLADSDWIPVLYSIANFPTLRNLEQIRNDIAYPNRHVIICAVGAGLAYGSLGTSHFAIEDVGVLRTLPNMRILSPSGPKSASLALKSAVNIPLPTYLRLGKAGEVNIFHSASDAHQALRLIIKGQADACVISSGSIGSLVLDTMSKGIWKPSFYSIEELWPLSGEIKDLIRRQKRILVVEEHVKTGGLYSILAEEILSCGAKAEIKSLAVDPLLLQSAGSQDFLRDISGLNQRDLQVALEWLERS